MKKFVFSLEEDRPSIDWDNGKESEFDILHEAVSLQEKTKADEAPDTVDQIDSVDTSPTTGEDSEIQPALESWLVNHRTSKKTAVALEGEYVEFLKSKLASAKNKLTDSLKELLDKTLAAANSGTQAIKAYVAKRVSSIQRLKGRLNELKGLVEKLAESDVVLPEGAAYKQSGVSNKLISAKDGDMPSSLKSYSTFFDQTCASFFAGVVKETEQIKLMIGQALSNPSVSNTKYLHPSFTPKGMVEREVPGYKLGDGLESLCSELLPGNTVFVAFWPKVTKDQTELVKAMTSASAVVGIDSSAEKANDEVPFVTAPELVNCLNAAQQLVARCEDHTQDYSNVSETRTKLGGLLKAFSVKVLSDDEETHKQSVDAIAAKLAFVDQVCLMGLMSLHTFTIQYIENTIAFAKENAKVLAKA